MLFARWQHHLRLCSGFPYAPLKAMVTKISKWSRIQDSFRITPKIESLVVFAIPDIPRKFQKNPSITFWVILPTHRHTNKQSLAKNITSLAEVTIGQPQIKFKRALLRIYNQLNSAKNLIASQTKKKKRPMHLITCIQLGLCTVTSWVLSCKLQL